MSTQHARERLLEAAYRSFYRKGFARSGLDDIAAEAGVTKKTLYYHFPSKDDLLAAVLELQREAALQQIQQWAAMLDGEEAQHWVGKLFDEIGHWGAQPWFTGTGFSRAAMELADLPGHPARKVARAHKRAVEDWFTARLIQSGVKDAGGRAREIVLLLEGALVLMLIHGDPAYAAAACNAAKALLGVDGSAAKPQPY
jgi:AcrR family transcriptional regulator